MSHSPLGRTLLIANPTARSGQGKIAAEHACTIIREKHNATSDFSLELTSSPGDATRIVKQAHDIDTIVVLGGDGIIHETVNGLMALPDTARPQLGIVPFGSGNDYARTLGIARNDVATALTQLTKGEARTLDLGRVNDVYYMQTLSFGLDAAIALDTTTRRANKSSQRGSALFVTSGIKIFSQAKEGFSCRVRFDEDEPLMLRTLIFAIQIGSSYGGGFRICPDASPTDGLLSICYNTKKPPLPHVLALFARARFGRHTTSPVINLRTTHHVEIDFEVEPPAQVDGEKILGTHFEIESVPAALRVIVP